LDDDVVKPLKQVWADPFEEDIGSLSTNTLSDRFSKLMRAAQQADVGMLDSGVLADIWSVRRGVDAEAHSASLKDVQSRFDSAFNLTPDVGADSSEALANRWKMMSETFGVDVGDSTTEDMAYRWKGLVDQLLAEEMGATPFEEKSKIVGEGWMPSCDVGDLSVEALGSRWGDLMTMTSGLGTDVGGLCQPQLGLRWDELTKIANFPCEIGAASSEQLEQSFKDLPPSCRNVDVGGLEIDQLAMRYQKLMAAADV